MRNALEISFVLPLFLGIYFLFLASFYLFYIPNERSDKEKPNKDPVEIDACPLDLEIRSLEY